MLLAIDVGNTNATFGVFEGDKLVDSYRVRTNAHATADELALQIRGLLADISVTGMAISSTVPAVLHELRRMVDRYFPDVPVVVVEPGMAISSTVPAVLHELRRMVDRYFPDVPVVVVEPGTRTGVPLLYDNPREVGPDRIANTLAAFHLYGGPAVVVDFGTSTNFDVVSAKGEFLGGVLAIGIEVGIDALAARGARLFKVEMSKPRSVVGKSTQEALQSGLLYGTVGQIDGIVRRIVGEIGGDAQIIATGGLAPLVLAESETVQHHEPDLTLIGLRLVFERNQG